MAEKPSSDRISFERKFVGTFAPVELHDLVESRELSIQAAWLAMVIDSLARGKKNKRRWCYAGNEFLGSKIGRKADTIQKLLQSLEKARMLVSRFTGRLRLLRIDYGGITKKQRAKTYLERDPEKNPGIPGKKSGSDPEKNPPRVYTDKKDRNGDYPRRNSHSFSESSKAAHIQLRTALKRNNKITGNRKGSVQAFARLEAKGIEYQSRLNWFCNNCGKEGGLPSVIDGIDFCSPKVFTWIGDVQKKNGKAESNAVFVQGKRYHDTGRFHGGLPLYERNGKHFIYIAAEDDVTGVTL